MLVQKVCEATGLFPQYQQGALKGGARGKREMRHVKDATLELKPSSSLKWLETRCSHATWSWWARVGCESRVWIFWGSWLLPRAHGVDCVRMWWLLAAQLFKVTIDNLHLLVGKSMCTCVSAASTETSSNQQTTLVPRERKANTHIHFYRKLSFWNKNLSSTFNWDISHSGWKFAFSDYCQKYTQRQEILLYQ